MSRTSKMLMFDTSHYLTGTTNVVTKSLGSLRFGRKITLATALMTHLSVKVRTKAVVVPVAGISIKSAARLGRKVFLITIEGEITSSLVEKGSALPKNVTSHKAGFPCARSCSSREMILICLPLYLSGNVNDPVPDEVEFH